MSEAERTRLVANLAGSLAQVSNDDVVDRSISYFAVADGELGQRLSDDVSMQRNTK